MIQKKIETTTLSSFIKQGLKDRQNYPQTNNTVSTINAITVFHKISSAIRGNSTGQRFASSFAVRLSLFIIEIIKNNRFAASGDLPLGEGFYRFCLTELFDTELAREIDDDELLIIYLKQCVYIR